MFIKYVRQRLRPHPRRALQVRTVKHRISLESLDRAALKLRARKIREQQHRPLRLGRHITWNQPRQRFQFLRRAVRTVRQQNLLPLMFDEPNTVLHKKPQTRNETGNQKLETENWPLITDP